MKVSKSKLLQIIKEDIADSLNEELEVERTSDDLLVLRLPGSDARGVLNKEQAIDLARKIMEAFPNEDY